MLLDRIFGNTPSRDWIKFVVTGATRYKIREYLHREETRKSLDVGQVLASDELLKHKK